MPAPERLRGFRFYPGDFIADPAVQAMTTEQVGAYMLLLCAAWQSDRPGVLPNLDPYLAGITRLGDRWPEHREAVLRAFVVRGETLVQKRMVLEAKAASEAMARARSGARAAANARWDKEMHARALPAQCVAMLGVGVGVENQRLSADEAGAPDASESTDRPSEASVESEPNPGVESPPEANRSAVLGLLGGLAGAMKLPEPPPRKSLELQLAWDWVRANTDATKASAAMRFVGWLVKTGTRDPDSLLALAKHFVVYAPENPHAYYTSKGTARQSIIMRVGGDRAVAEHERIKADERRFLGGNR
jgi:uncharacterized protein YdaU (DUF1376 family)